jgi:hypothetical protein
MRVRIVHMNLPKPSHLLPKFSVREKRMAVLNNILLEGDLGARKQTHRHGWLSDCGKTASDGVGKIRRYQLVSDLRGSRLD